MKRWIMLLSATLICSSFIAFGADSYTLADLEQSMFIHNNELRKMELELYRSTLDVKDAKWQRWPTVKVQASASYIDNTLSDAVVLDPDALLALYHWPSGTSPTASGDYLTIYEGLEPIQYQFTAELTQPIFTWGKINNAIKLAQAVSDAKSLQLVDQRKRLSTQLAMYVDAVIRLEAIKTLLEEQLYVADKLVRLTEEAFMSGLVLKLDVQKAIVQRSQLDVALANTTYELKKALLSLQTMTGISDLQTKHITHTIDVQMFDKLAEKDEQDILGHALSIEQPSVAALRQLEQAAALNADVSKASLSWKPDFALVADIGYGGSRFPFIETDWYRQNDYSLTISIGLQSMLWDGGSSLRALRRAISTQESADTESKAALDTIRQTIAEKFAALKLALATAEWQTAQIDMLNEALKIKQTVFATGYGEESEVLAAQLEVLAASIAYEQAMMDASISYHTIMTFF